MSTPPKVSVCLVDDDSDVRSALRLLMKSEGIPLVSCASGKEFFQALEQKSIGCVLLDVRMPEVDGLQVLEELHARKVPVPVILLTAHATVPVAVRAVQLGALDIIEKPFQDEQLIEAVRKGLALHDRYRKILEDRQTAATRIAELTRREVEVLDLMVSGMPNREIAEQLGISPKTLDIHRANVMDKMEARTTADLVRQRLLERADPLALPYLFPLN